MKQIVIVVIMSLISAILSALNLRAQNKQEDIVLGFYNLENLFDTVNNLDTSDDEYSVKGVRNWTVEKFQTKVGNLARAITLFEPDVLGVCEVETSNVLDQLTFKAPMTNYQWGTVHYDSPDPRGIDVGLIYRSDKFEVVESEPIKANFNRPTRDILWTQLRHKVSGECMVVIVVHLPSRRNNDPMASAQRKAMLSQINNMVSKAVIENKDRGVVVLGDFNDNPTSSTMKRALGSLYNTSVPTFGRGMGSYIYQDTYLMYDQILVSHNMKPRLKTSEQKVVSHPSLFQQDGRFAHYPAKGVISDHLPVYVKIAGR